MSECARIEERHNFKPARHENEHDPSDEFDVESDPDKPKSQPDPSCAHSVESSYPQRSPHDDRQVGAAKVVLPSSLHEHDAGKKGCPIDAVSDNSSHDPLYGIDSNDITSMAESHGTAHDIRPSEQELTMSLHGVEREISSIDEIFTSLHDLERKIGSRNVTFSTGLRDAEHEISPSSAVITSLHDTAQRAGLKDDSFTGLHDSERNYNRNDLECDGLNDRVRNIGSGDIMLNSSTVAQYDSELDFDDLRATKHKTDLTDATINSLHNVEREQLYSEVTLSALDDGADEIGGRELTLCDLHDSEYKLSLDELTPDDVVIKTCSGELTLSGSDDSEYEIGANEVMLRGLHDVANGIGASELTLSGLDEVQYEMGASDVTFGSEDAMAQDGGLSLRGETDNTSLQVLEQCACDNSSLTPRLHNAVLRCDVGEVRRILSLGADPDEPDWSLSGNPPILLAAATGSVPVVRALIEAGCCVGARTVRGETALHLALSGRHVDVALVTTLLDAGCDASTPENLRHQTPLHQAIRHLASDQFLHQQQQLLQTFRRIVELGDVNAIDHRSRSPLHRLAASTCDHLEPLHILLKHGADLNIRNDRGETALHEALERDRALRFIVPLAGQTDLFLRSNYHETPLHVAARKNRPDVVACLLKREAPLNGQDLRGNTALHLAAGKGYKDVVRQLIESPGIELNAPNKEGHTALHFAVESGFIHVVEMLLKAEACDPLAKTKLRQTPLDLAQQDYRRRSQPEMSIVLTRELARRHSCARFS